MTSLKKSKSVYDILNIIICAHLLSIVFEFKRNITDKFYQIVINQVIKRFLFQYLRIKLTIKLVNLVFF
jgi:hypothetical protein